jgi:Lon protease-like protein/uncharacterized protein YndB with AHSA1/START domain
MPASAATTATRHLPMMPIRGVVIFPCMMTPFVVGRPTSVRALEAALAGDRRLFLATQHDASIAEPAPGQIYTAGTIVNIVQSLKLPDGNIKVLVEGVERARAVSVESGEGFFRATVETPAIEAESGPDLDALVMRLTSLFERYVRDHRNLNYETMIGAISVEEPAKLADSIAANLPLAVAEKQELLEIFDPVERLARLAGILGTATEQVPGTVIHQEVDLPGEPARIYRILLDAKQFSAFTGRPAQIQAQPGGAFQLFAGGIEGRNLELVEDRRIVQAWRSTRWPAGVYSIVRLELAARGPETRVVLDHSGFTEDRWERLRAGWRNHYWDPLRKYLLAGRP